MKQIYRSDGVFCKLKKGYSNMSENNREIHTPFKFKEGEYYSIVDEEDDVVGIFISNGEVWNYPNGNNDGNIGYRIHAAMFAYGRIFNPVVLAGPEFDGNGGLYYPREFGVRYANEKEVNLLNRRMESKRFKWNPEKMCIEKCNPKKK